MIRFKSRGALYGEVWYDEDPPRDVGVDVIAYRQRAAPVAATRQSPFLTIVTDLAVQQDAIMDRFGKNCRQKIRRAETRDELEMEFITEPEDRLDEFSRFYDAFAGQKSLQRANRRWLLGACKAGQLALASALQNGETLVWHAYVMGGTTAWLQYSASCFRDQDHPYRALVARANRWLHWSSMLRFREIGMARYDWGGLFEDESVAERAGINRFKKEFGGQQVHTYDCIAPLTFTGHVRLSMHDAWRRCKPVRELPKMIFERELLQGSRVSSAVAPARESRGSGGESD